jgi:hypothetical protein
MLVVLLIAAAPNLPAQNVTAALTGTVTDPSGAVVPKANVTLTNEATADVRRTVANSDGYFTFAAVPPGTYTVAVEQTGFSVWEANHITLDAGDKRNLSNIALKVGTTKETVVVEGGASQVTPVDSGEKSTLISAKMLSNVAILGQNAAEFIKIMPGMAITGGALNQSSYAAADERTGNGPAGNFSANGLRTAANDITSDGAHITDPGSNAGQAINTNADMTAEVKVMTSNFGADSSKGPVVINVIGKSGSQQFHGEAYVYARNYALNANNWLNNSAGVNSAGQMSAPRPPTRYWYPGGNIGGPVYIPGKSFNKNKDKLFFFFAAEYYKQNVDNGIYRAQVPTAAMRKGDFSDTAYLKTLGTDGAATALSSTKYPNGIIPSSQIPSYGTALVNIYPLPNANPAQNSNNNYVANPTRYSNFVQYRPRIDYAINDNTKLYVSYNIQRDHAEESLDTLWTGNAQSWASPTVPYASPLIEKSHSDSVSANLTKVFSPTLTNELVFTYTYLYLPNSFQDPTKVERGSLGLNYPMLFSHTNADKLIIPEMTGWGDGIANILNSGFELNGTVYAKKKMPTIADNVSKVWGTHTAKFGFYWERTFNEQPGNSNVNGQGIFATWGGNSTGNVYGDVLTGNFNSYNEQNFNTVPSFRYLSAQFFAQDSWKVTRRLTLEYGIRVSHLGPWSDLTGYGFAVWNQSQYNNDPSVAMNMTGLSWHKINSSVPLSGAASRAFFYDPRLGLAWDIRGDAKTVLRGGYGMYHYHDEQNVQNAAYGITQGSWNYNEGGADNLANLGNYKVSASAPGAVSALDPKDSAEPRTQSYSFSVDQRLPWKTVFEVGYVGNKADYLSNYNNSIGTLNLLPVGSLFKCTGQWIPAGYSNSQIAACRPMDNYQSVKIVNHKMYSNYNGLQASLNRQVGHLTVMANYSFGKALGIRGENGAGVGDPTNFNNLYGTLPNNRTHIFNAAYIYELPKFAKTNAFAKAIENGWQISGVTQIQSGSDIQASMSSNMNFSAYIPNGYTYMNTVVPDGTQIGNQNWLGTGDITLMPKVTCDPRKNLKAHQYFNASCFTAPTTIGSNGDYIFPVMTGPAFFNSDLTMFKKFYWGKEQSRTVELRFSGYNFLNHPLTTFVSGNETGMQVNYSQTGTLNPNAGYAMSKTGGRVVQIALKILF